MIKDVMQILQLKQKKIRETVQKQQQHFQLQESLPPAHHELRHC